MLPGSVSSIAALLGSEMVLRSMGILFLLALVKEFEGGALEALGATLIFLCLLKLLSFPHYATVILIVFFGGIMLGLMLIDAAFDIIVLTGMLPLTVAGTQLSAREVAWIYYRTMLNSHAVNTTAAFCISCIVPAIPAFGFRSEPQQGARFRTLALLSLVNIGAYVFVIVPRYYHLRRESTFDPTLFNQWEVVVAARLVCLLTICISLPIIFSIMHEHVTSPPAPQKRVSTRHDAIVQSHAARVSCAG